MVPNANSKLVDILPGCLKRMAHQISKIFHENLAWSILSRNSSQNYLLRTE